MTPGSGALLAIEMSQRGGSVAVGTDAGRLVIERFDAAGSRDVDPLLPAIDRATKAHGCGPRGLAAVAVSAGPGGFTGLRVSVTATKCLGEALGVAVIAVPSALVAAESATGPADRVVALAAKRETAWIALVTGNGEGLRIEGEPSVLSASEIRWPQGARTLLADEFAPEGILASATAAGILVERPLFDAAACWRVGLRMWRRGDVVDPLHLAPIYPREPEAVTLWRLRHGE